MIGQTITYEQMQQLISQNEKLVQVMEAMLDRIEMNAKEWYTPDEALNVLGFHTTKNSRRRLQYLRDNNLLTKFGSLKPFTYDAQQVKEVADLIRAGRIAVPAKF
ncbi:MAG: hypothetical protein KDC85_23105 [Saprospiraceae bacterium]|nr:hypothetical protein [Saprospiraceae bacterium]